MSILPHLKLNWMVNAKSPFFKLIFLVFSVLIFQWLSRKNQSFLSSVIFHGTKMNSIAKSKMKLKTFKSQITVKSQITEIGPYRFY